MPYVKTLLKKGEKKKWGSSDKSSDNDTFTNETSWKMETIIYNNLRPI